MNNPLWSYPNRYICSRLDEILKCHETHSYTLIPALVHQVRILATHMEEALEDKRDIYSMIQERHALKKELADLKEEKKKLKKELGKDDKPGTDG